MSLVIIETRYLGEICDYNDGVQKPWNYQEESSKMGQDPDGNSPNEGCFGRYGP